MVFRGEEVNRSVRKNRVMKEKNLQKWLTDKTNDKLKARKGTMVSQNLMDRLESE